MFYLATILITLLLAVPAMSVELFRYQYLGEDGQKYECVYETDNPSGAKTVREEKAEIIAAEWITIFYHVRIGAIVRTEFHTKPIPYWLFRFSGTIRGPVKRMLFAIVLPDGTVVQPTVPRRL